MPNARVQAVARLLHRSTGHTHEAFGSSMVARARKPVVSTQTLDFKVQHTAKSKQSWRYPGGNIVRHPHRKINGTTYTDHKDPGENRRKQESNFFLTINTNKAPESQFDIDRCTKALKRTLEALAADAAIASYLKFGPKDEHYRDDKYNDVVHSVDWKANVEVGDNLKRVHAHVWMTVSHYSQVQINVHALMALVRSEYNKDFPNFHDVAVRMNDMPYVHVKLLPQSDWTDVMRQYIHKAMAGA